MSQFNLSLFCSQKHPMSNPEKNYHFFQNIRILSRFSVQSITFFHKNIPCRIPKKKDPMSCLKEVTSSVPREFTGGEFMVMTPTPGD